MSKVFEWREENFIRPLFLSLVAALLVPEIGRNILYPEEFGENVF